MASLPPAPAGTDRSTKHAPARYHCLPLCGPLPPADSATLHPYATATGPLQRVQLVDRLVLVGPLQV